MTTRTAPTDPAPTGKAQSRSAQPADTDSDTAAAQQDPAARIAELESELAKAVQQARKHDPAGDGPPEPTHVQVLATGEQVETSAPCATEHHSDQLGTVVPVVSVFEIPREVS